MRERHAILLNQAEKLFKIESWHRHDRRAQVQTHIEDHHEAVNVKERQDAKQRIVAMKVIEPIHLAHIRHQIVVSEHDPLWQTRCTARIRQCHQVFSRINRHRCDIAITFQQRIKRRSAFCFAEHKQLFDHCRLRGDARLFNKLWRSDQQLSARVFELADCFFRCVQRIQSCIHAAQHSDGMKSNRVLGTVWAEDSEYVAFLESSL